MIRAGFALASAALMLAGTVGSAQQAVVSEAVLVRDTTNQLVVTAVLAKPGDEVEISDGVVVVNDRQTEVRVEPGGDWGPRIIAPATYFVAGDPAALGTDPHEWGLIPADRIVGTVQVGAAPMR